MKKLLSILIPTIIILVLIAQIDDDLTEEAASLIDRLEATAESESYLFLSGIFAKEGESPLRVGRHILDESKKFDADESYDINEYPDHKKLVLPKGDEFCKAWEDDCLKYLFLSNVNVESLLIEHSLLVSRSNRFIDFDEYRTLSTPSIHESFPPYHYIAAAERIKVLAAISAYRNGDAKKAIDSLGLQLSKLRKTMELQDTLIGKLVLLMKLSEIIDVMSIIISNENTKTEKIHGLSQSEKSFYMIAAREFGMSYYMFKDLDKNPEFFEVGGNFPGWLTRIVYKPNMTINAVAPMYLRLEYLAELSPSEFSTKVEAADKISLSTSKLKNYAGSVLINISPEFEEYVARFSDFDAKLALFNQIHHLGLEFDAMQNPYYGKEAPSESNGSLCFSGPFEDERSLRCLRVKL